MAGFVVRFIVDIRPAERPGNAATSITLKGYWLEYAGFTTGIPLKIRVMPGCLVLTAQEPLPPPPPEPEIMQTLKKVCKLSGRKQRQILEFIEMVTAKKATTGKWG
ncbi:SymE family type I addiction module toxin [Enterobacteriaceae bacterium H20N1]|uniref:SymE family type I addiction module toxin n=1 Tax=Dryocola boscaweniae TaxID=2925397 RepID=A0A9X2W3C5_9ENTR|nr:SymE family type I addiction module toxin [Dryocola boscaweniae]MCT4700305.1 SymE family type I addiction module toxin [Dryocola boscaweniae]MCT4717532.1 SymE family type I addiction module toxin [Dryocola boscaweniae]